MQQILIKDKKYRGMYVAVKNMDDTRVIASGKSYKDAHKKAVSKGYEKHLLIYIPEKDTVHIY